MTSLSLVIYKRILCLLLFANFLFPIERKSYVHEEANLALSGANT